MFENTIDMIVRNHGGYREKTIWKNPHEVVISRTWNNDHKVLYILSTVPDEDGYHVGFSVDIITRSIVG